MINLMYIVLTAMLALNVSSDVLNGFRQVEEGLVRTTENVAAQNESLYDELSTYYHNNPEKSGEWYHKATAVHQHTDSLYDYIATLKQRIVREADGMALSSRNMRLTSNGKTTSKPPRSSCSPPRHARGANCAKPSSDIAKW